MQLMISQSSLAKALNVLRRIVPRRPMAPLAGGVWAEARDDRLLLFATDMHSTVEVALPADVHVPGRAVVMARVLAGITATLGDEDVLLSMSSSGESLRITAGPAAFRLPTLTTDANPLRVAAPPAHGAIQSEHLIDLIQRTTFCAVDSEDLSPFAGVMVAAEDDTLTMAATDNYQLAYYALPLRAAAEPAGGMKPEAVLPSAALTLMARAMKAMEVDTVSVAWGERTVWFSAEHVVCSVRRLDIAYPDLSRFMGTVAGVRIHVDKNRFVAALRQVASIGGESHRRVCLTIDGNRVHLTSADQELGEAHTVVQLDKHHPHRRIWLDAQRMIDGLRGQPADRIALHVSEPLAPVVICPIDPNIQYRTVLTPIRYVETEEGEAAV